MKFKIMIDDEIIFNKEVTDLKEKEDLISPDWESRKIICTALDYYFKATKKEMGSKYSLAQAKTRVLMYLWVYTNDQKYKKDDEEYSCSCICVPCWKRSGFRWAQEL